METLITIAVGLILEEVAKDSYTRFMGWVVMFIGVVGACLQILGCKL